MAQVKLVQKKMKMNHRNIIKFQILTHCFVNEIQLSNNELDCLTLLGAFGQYELAEFCNIAVEEKIFKTSQTVRNFLTKAGNLNLVGKKGTNKKQIFLNEELNIQTEGNILFNINIIYVAEE